jgi:hypothetical protein
MVRRSRRLIRALTRLLPCCLALQAPLAVAQDTPADAPPHSPHQLVERLGVLTRIALEGREPHERARSLECHTAELLRRHGSGREALAEPDALGRTPLMLAVSGGHAAVVEALLGDPGVRASIHSRNHLGETAWMLAVTAPAVTLPACEPQVLTQERHPLLVPYLLRASALMRDDFTTVHRIQRLLEAAGATPEPEAARQAWLARCPHAQHATRERMARRTLPGVLLTDTVERVNGFNSLYVSAPAQVPSEPPAALRFVPADPAALALPLRNVALMNCTTRPPPAVRGAMSWSGSVTVTVRALTRAGIVEVADLETPPGTDPLLARYFRQLVLRSLSAYRCEGDAVFEQAFAFRIE